MPFEANKKYTDEAKLGIRGEGFFESIISKYAIPHHIEGLKDIGIDFICQWVYKTNPTKVFFATQIKTFITDGSDAQPINEGPNDLNKLDEFRINYKGLWIKPTTRRYWQGFNMPVYLFAICSNDADGWLDCYYKRYTPILLNESKPRTAENFFKVNEGFKFLAFAKTSKDEKESEGFLGFARDLFIDYMRCSYFQGSAEYLDPTSLGLRGYPDRNAILIDLAKDYGRQLVDAYFRLEDLIDKVPELKKEMLEERKRRQGFILRNLQLDIVPCSITSPSGYEYVTGPVPILGIEDQDTKLDDI